MPGASGKGIIRSQGSPGRSRLGVVGRGLQEARREAEEILRARGEAVDPMDREAVEAVTQAEGRLCTAGSQTDRPREGRPRLAEAAVAAEAAGDPEMKGIPAAGRRGTNVWETLKRP